MSIQAASVSSYVGIVFEVNLRRRDVPDEELLADLRATAERLGITKLTMDEYNEHGAIHASTVARRFSGWMAACRRAGLGRTHNLGDADDDWFENIRHVWEVLGRQPRYLEMESPVSRYSAAGYGKRFGSWTNALAGFAAWVAEDGDTIALAPAPEGGGSNTDVTVPRGPRKPSTKLRFQVLQRDRFSCVACGASPAKTAGVELHVDHVQPWSRGGVTELENLQALCAKCNYGKSDTVPDTEPWAWSRPSVRL